MLDERLITSEVCIRCGACCSLYVRKGTTELVSLDEIASPEDVEIIACPQLVIAEGRYTCGAYETRPQTCRDYHCVKQANRKGLVLTPDSAMGSRIHRALQLALVD